MSILVTGSTGFIGTELVEALVSRGETVHVLSRSGRDDASSKSGNIRLFQGDILDTISIQRSIKGCDRVFHLAAYAKNWAKDSKTFFDVNVGGLKNTLDAAVNEGVKKIVFTSTSLTSGPSNELPVTESMARAREFFTDYERSKYMAEELARRYVVDGTDIVIVNPTRVFGPGLLTEGNSATKMIQWYLLGKWRIILGDGERLGNYAFIEDVVRGHLLAMDAGRSGEKYVLGGENVSYNEFFRTLSEISARNYKLFHVPPSIALSCSKIEELRARFFNHYPLITPGWVRTFLEDWAFSTDKAQHELGYTITPLRTALKKTIGWLSKDLTNNQTRDENDHQQV